MIEANTKALKRRLSVLETESRRVRKLIDVFEIASGATTLTPSQKTDILAEVQPGRVSTAFDDAAEAFTSDTPVVEPEE